MITITNEYQKTEAFETPEGWETWTECEQRDWCQEQSDEMELLDLPLEFVRTYVQEGTDDTKMEKLPEIPKDKIFKPEVLATLEMNINTFEHVWGYRPLISAALIGHSDSHWQIFDPKERHNDEWMPVCVIDPDTNEADWGVK